MSHTGTLLIADITGYTMYLSQSELDHARETLQALLELLIENTKPPLILSRLAGDAVISYGLEADSLRGQTFVELLEGIYIRFRRAIERMVLNNTCQCNACANVSQLDLKFFVHYGTFGIQRLSAQDELVGNDVNLIHRLLKNHVTQETGVRAYTLFTDAALRQLGLADFENQLIRLSESYDHLGEVTIWIQDMHPVWRAKRDTTRIDIPPERILVQAEAELALPPEVVWEYLSEPAHRKVLIGSDRQEIVAKKDGRVAPGSVYQCYHGDKVISQTVLEWRPFEQVLTQDVIPMPIKGVTVLVDYRLEPTATGTRLIQSASKASGPWLGRILCDLILPRLHWQADIDKFKNHIEEDQKARHHGRLEGADPPAASGEAAAPAPPAPIVG